MADQPESVPLFPPETIPTVFADAVMNLAWTPQVAKFYLARFDPSANNTKGNVSRPFTQIVLPMPGFLDAFAFFEQQIASLLEEGTVTAEQIAEARARYSGKRP